MLDLELMTVAPVVVFLETLGGEAEVEVLCLAWWVLTRKTMTAQRARTMMMRAMASPVITTSP